MGEAIILTDIRSGILKYMKLGVQLTLNETTNFVQPVAGRNSFDFSPTKRITTPEQRRPYWHRRPKDN